MKKDPYPYRFDKTGLERPIKRTAFSEFASNWYNGQYHGIMAMFSLFGNIAKEMSIGGLEHSTGERLLREYSPAIVDETGRSKRSNNGIFHYELFAQDVKKMGIDVNLDQAISKHTRKFIWELHRDLDSVVNLAGYMTATEDCATKIFPWMRRIFEIANAPSDAFKYISLHESIEKEHKSETEKGSKILIGTEKEILKWQRNWDEWLFSLNVTLSD